MKVEAIVTVIAVAACLMLATSVAGDEGGTIDWPSGSELSGNYDFNDGHSFLLSQGAVLALTGGFTLNSESYSPIVTLETGSIVSIGERQLTIPFDFQIWLEGVITVSTSDDKTTIDISEGGKLAFAIDDNILMLFGNESTEIVIEHSESDTSISMSPLDMSILIPKLGTIGFLGMSSEIHYKVDESGKGTFMGPDDGPIVLGIGQIVHETERSTMTMDNAALTVQGYNISSTFDATISILAESCEFNMIDETMGISIRGQGENIGFSGRIAILPDFSISGLRGTGASQLSFGTADLEADAEYVHVKAKTEGLGISYYTGPRGTSHGFSLRNAEVMMTVPDGEISADIYRMDINVDLDDSFSLSVSVGSINIDSNMSARGTAESFTSVVNDLDLKIAVNTSESDSPLTEASLAMSGFRYIDLHRDVTFVGTNVSYGSDGSSASFDDIHGITTTDIDTVQSMNFDFNGIEIPDLSKLETVSFSRIELKFDLTNGETSKARLTNGSTDGSHVTGKAVFTNLTEDLSAHFNGIYYVGPGCDFRFDDCHVPYIEIGRGGKIAGRVTFGCGGYVSYDSGTLSITDDSIGVTATVVLTQSGIGVGTIAPLPGYGKLPTYVRGAEYLLNEDGTATLIDSYGQLVIHPVANTYRIVVDNTSYETELDGTVELAIPDAPPGKVLLGWFDGSKITIGNIYTLTVPHDIELEPVWGMDRTVSTDDIEIDASDSDAILLRTETTEGTVRISMSTGILQIDAHDIPTSGLYLYLFKTTSDKEDVDMFFVGAYNPDGESIPVIVSIPYEGRFYAIGLCSSNQYGKTVDVMNDLVTQDGTTVVSFLVTSSDSMPSLKYYAAWFDSGPNMILLLCGIVFVIVFLATVAAIGRRESRD